MGVVTSCQHVTPGGQLIGQGTEPWAGWETISAGTAKDLNLPNELPTSLCLSRVFFLGLIAPPKTDRSVQQVPPPDKTTYAWSLDFLTSHPVHLLLPHRPS